MIQASPSPQLKVVCVDDSLNITYEHCIVFDTALPEFEYVM